MNAQDIATCVSVISLLGSFFSLYFSRQALMKADHAISIEKSSHFVNHLKNILQEIDEWKDGYEALKRKYIVNYKTDLIYELDESFYSEWELIWEYITKYEGRLQSTYPTFFKNLDKRRDEFFKRICEIQKRGDDLDEIEFVLDSRVAVVSHEYRKFIIELITERTDKFY